MTVSSNQYSPHSGSLCICFVDYGSPPPTCSPGFPPLRGGAIRSRLLPTGCWPLARLRSSQRFIAGLQAYYTVDHDAPSHAAMDDPSKTGPSLQGSAIILLAIWRWTNRAKAASTVFIAGLTAAALALTVTALVGRHDCLQAMVSALKVYRR